MDHPAPPGWASWREVRAWMLISLTIAVLMLIGVVVVAYLQGVPRSIDHDSSLLDQNHDLHGMLAIVKNNTLVLTIHVMACWLGALISQPFKPAPEEWGRIAQILHRPVPDWLARFSLAYAALVTLGSVALQTRALGEILAEVSAGAGLTPGAFLSVACLHAIPELVGIFLPLALFLRVSRQGRLRALQKWTWQSAAIGLPLIVAAAAAETFVTPALMRLLLF